LEKIEMKKTLVAVAAMAAIAGAHADVTITGVLESSIVSSGGVRSIGGGSNGTEIDFGVSEDLGSGLKAIGSVALLVNPNAGSIATGSYATHGNASTTTTATGSVSAYNSYIGLSSSDVGTLKIGQLFSTVFLATAAGDPTGHAGYSNALAGNGAGNAFQVANSLNYSSPKISGFTLNYQKTLNSTLVAQQYTGYGLDFSAGAFNIATAYAVETPTSTTTRKETAIGANYDLGVAKLFVATTNITQSATATKSYTDYGISVPVGAVTLTANAGTGYNNLSNVGASITYAFSKRTSAYYAYNNGYTTVNTVTQQVGIRHNF